VAGKSFSRDAVVNIVMSEVEHAQIRDLVANASSIEPPVDTRLQKTAQTEKNVVLIHLESARARSMTPYNEDLDTTPYLDTLSKNSLLAERAYTIVPHTSKAVTSINCGIDPHLVREITEAEPGGVPARCLPELLKEQGYNSVWFSSATEHFEDRRDLVENFGYDDFRPVETMETEGFQKSNYFGYEDDIMLQPSRSWLEQHKDEPFLATYLGVTGHHDYRPIDRYGQKDYSNSPPLDHYQNEMRYLDFFVRNVIDQYKELGLYDDTIFVIYGDHGEGFGEHDLYQHDNTIYQEGLKVPFIIHAPGRFEEGKRVETLTNQLDILPTLFDMLGYKVKGGHYPGISLLGPPQEDRTLFFSCLDEYRCLASIQGTEKYIYFFGNQPEEVYDLASDPLERNNIADELSRKELKNKRLQVLAWYSKVNAMYEERDPGQE
jgi:phosphoglycerol transferase MdoB-like AlkP superfamily enzyme